VNTEHLSQTVRIIISVVDRRMVGVWGMWPPKLRTWLFAYTRHEKDLMTFVFP